LNVEIPCIIHAISESLIHDAQIVLPSQVRLMDGLFVPDGEGQLIPVNWSKLIMCRMQGRAADLRIGT
jgi:hypothetical protein